MEEFESFLDGPITGNMMFSNDLLAFSDAELIETFGDKPWEMHQLPAKDTHDSLALVPSTDSNKLQYVPAHQDNDKALKTPRRQALKKHHCMATGCLTDLSSLAYYYQRNKVCSFHSKADFFLINSVPSRFCQRCGIAHEVSQFEGTRRSCKKALDRYNSKRRAKAASVALSEGTTAADSPKDKAPAHLVSHTDLAKVVDGDDSEQLHAALSLPSQLQLHHQPSSSKQQPLQLYMVLAPPNTHFADNVQVLSVHTTPLTSASETVNTQQQQRPRQ
jgi:hypothetical protein